MSDSYARPMRGNPFPLFIAVRPAQAVCFEIGDTSQAKPMAFGVGFPRKPGLSPWLPVIPCHGLRRLEQQRGPQLGGRRISSPHQKRLVEHRFGLTGPSPRASRRVHLRSMVFHRPLALSQAKVTIPRGPRSSIAHSRFVPTGLPRMRHHRSRAVVMLLLCSHPLKGISHE